MSSKKGTVLVVEDDLRTSKLIQRNLELEGFRVLTATDGQGGLKLAETESPDLIILDIMLPGGMSGTELCRRIRQFSVVPIVMVTARAGEEDKVAALDTGADDYLTKPFSIPELQARVRSALRRSTEYTGDSTQPIFTVGELTVDFGQHIATIRQQPVNLTPTEYRLLAYLASNAGRVVTQTDLLNKVWGPEYKDEGHLLRVNVARLRQKVEPTSGEPRYIITRPGIGYYLVKEDTLPAAAGDM